MLPIVTVGVTQDSYQTRCHMLPNTADIDDGKSTKRETCVVKDN
jgi:hypothetical protein